jgi:hypothetical protein
MKALTSYSMAEAAAAVPIVTLTPISIRHRTGASWDLLRAWSEAEILPGAVMQGDVDIPQAIECDPSGDKLSPDPVESFSQASAILIRKLTREQIRGTDDALF